MKGNGAENANRNNVNQNRKENREMKQINFNLRFEPGTSDIECSSSKGATRAEYEDMVGTLIMSIYRHFQTEGKFDDAEEFRDNITAAISSDVFWDQYCSSGNSMLDTPTSSKLKN